MAFDPADGNPAVAYYGSTAQALRFAWHDGIAWDTQTVDSVGNVGRTPSLAFNDFGDGFPSIAYLNSSFGGSGQLYFIEDPPAVPEPSSLVLLAIGVAAMWFRCRETCR